MHTPGAAMSTAGPKFENVARVSSVWSCRQKNAPRHPPAPSPSATAETVITSGWLAGLTAAASMPSLPAATTNVMPAATELAMAVSKLVLLKAPARLMLTTSISPARAVTQSIPAISEVRNPVPSSPSTFTDHTRAPGATPTTPYPLSSAAAIPATWVPWP